MKSREQKTQNAEQASAHGWALGWGRLARAVEQAGSPLRPKRAALRAAQGFAPSLPAQPRTFNNLWGKITVVDGQNA